MKYVLIGLSLTATGLFLLSFGSGFSAWLFAALGVALQAAAVLQLPEAIQSSGGFKKIGLIGCLVAALGMSVTGSVSLLSEMLDQQPSNAAYIVQRDNLITDIENQQDAISTFLRYDRATKATQAQTELKSMRVELAELDRKIEMNKPTGVHVAMKRVFGDNAELAVTTLIVGIALLVDLVSLFIGDITPVLQPITTQPPAKPATLTRLDKLARKDEELTKKETEKTTEPLKAPTKAPNAVEALHQKAKAMIQSGALPSNAGYRKIQIALNCKQAEAMQVAKVLKR